MHKTIVLIWHGQVDLQGVVLLPGAKLDGGVPCSVWHVGWVTLLRLQFCCCCTT